MKNIHLIATDKPSRLFKDDNQVLNLHTHSVLKGIFTNGIGSNQHIYITNSEEIKELTNDWFIETDTNEIYKSDWIKFRFNNGKKIILTTDQDLIADGIEAIDDEFLEWFVNNTSCEEVDVMTDAFTVKEMSMLPIGTRNFKYKIIIPKEEAKQETVGKQFYENADMVISVIRNKETLEEAGKIDLTKLCYYDKRNPDCTADDEDIEDHKAQLLRVSKKLGYNKTCSCDNCFYGRTRLTEQLIWQQEQMYSKEEVEMIAKDAYEMGRKNILIGVFNKWFNQFKKK